MNETANTSLPQVTTGTTSYEMSPAVAQRQSLVNAQNYKKALHQQILLKARNESAGPSFSNNQLSSSMFNCTMPALIKPIDKIQQQQLAQPKWTNFNNLVTISNTFPNTKPDEITHEDTDLLSLATSELFSQLNDELNLNRTSSETEELDTPMNIKDNITSSIRNLPLRSSAVSDDEDTQATNNNDVIIIGSLLPTVNNNGVVKLAIPLKTTTTINIPKLPSTNSTPVKNISLNSLSLLSSNNLNNHVVNLKSKPRIGKRLKDEALSNSSSSDEEEQQQQSRQKLCNSGQKLQQLTKPRTTQTIQSLIQQQQQQQQPKITPVVPATVTIAANAERVQSTSFDLMTCSSPSLLNQSMESSTSDLTNSSYSSKFSHKSLDSQDLSFSCVASPTSCCSSSSNSANNDSAIDLHDDNSSTASGPIYIRQPGFEHHAHEIRLEETTLFNPIEQNEINLSTILNTSNSKPKIGKKINEKNISFLTTNLNNNNTVNITKGSNKSKKKLCMMINDSDSNNQLKPISNKNKRDPLPMRLRALPQSFWQQPNQQQNINPSSMCLPPLNKCIDLDSSISDIDTQLTTSYSEQCKSESNLKSREVRISPANTDLLFKLFDQVEQKDKKQFKVNRMKTQTLCKTLIKGEDPCFVDSVTEGFFPILRLDSRSNPIDFKHLESNNSSYLTSNGLSNSSPVISSSELPILQTFEQNYSQALSDVVAAL